MLPPILSKANQTPHHRTQTLIAHKLKQSKAPTHWNPVTWRDMIPPPSTQPFLQIAPTLLTTIPSACPQNPTNDHPPLWSGGSCSTLFNPAGLPTLACPYAFQLVNSCPIASNTTNAAKHPEPCIYSTLTLTALLRFRSATGSPQKRGLRLAFPAMWCTPSLRAGTFSSVEVLYPMAETWPWQRLERVSSPKMPSQFMLRFSCAWMRNLVRGSRREEEEVVVVDVDAVSRVQKRVSVDLPSTQERWMVRWSPARGLNSRSSSRAQALILASSGPVRRA